MNLIQRIFNSVPDCIKVRIFELSNDEKWFMEALRKANRKIIAGIYYPTKEGIEECEKIKKEMEFIFDNRKENIRFGKYFLEKMGYVEDSIKLIRGYR